MASSTTIDVDYEIDKEDGGMDTLEFQDIPHSSGDIEKGKTHEFTNFPHSAVDSDEEVEEDSAKLLHDEKPASTSSFWTFAYYQQFFNVDTKQVGTRIIGSMLPKPGRNYLVKEIRPNPDLYGPFWVCTTLVFTTAIAGNLANYFSSAGEYHWRYDFHKVTFAATAIFGYWWLIPLVLFGLMWWQGYKERFSFLEMICVYGYSLAIYIPISVLWAIQVAWLQWLLVVLGAVLSGSVLLLTFWPTVSEGNKKIAIGVMVFIFVMHAALAAGFVLYFFHVPAGSSTTHPSTITNSSVAPVHINTQPPLTTGKQEPIKGANNVFAKNEAPVKDGNVFNKVVPPEGSNNVFAQNSMKNPIPNKETAPKMRKKSVPIPDQPAAPQKEVNQAATTSNAKNPTPQGSDETVKKNIQTEASDKGNKSR